MSVLTMRAVDLPSGETIPALGMGTWHLGRGPPSAEAVEIEALRTGLDLGMTLIDTAEMYGDGASERLVGRAIAGRRDECSSSARCCPTTRPATGRSPPATRACGGWAPTGSTCTSCTGAARSRWRRPCPRSRSSSASGRIRHWGVSNFDVADMNELMESIPGGRDVQTDQVLYNLPHRGIEWNLLPVCQRIGLPIMAYSPIEQGRLAGHPVLAGIGRRHKRDLRRRSRCRGSSRTPASARSRRPGRPSTCARTSARSRVVLEQDDVVELDAAFPPPPRPVPLEVL